ncbi:hypothetical protein BSKO_01211 [Bryopsis sp. KO-2023]|nr:hypothetical protein BSKO_01211 [Bryopsis sp. KO-2023]
MDRVTAGGNGLGHGGLPQLLPDIDVHRQISDEDFQYFVLRSTPQQLHADITLQSSQQGQLLGEPSRSTPHVARCPPGGHHGLVGLSRDSLQHNSGSVMVGQNGQLHSPQVAGTLNVPSGLLLDNYVIKSDPLKGRLLQRAPEEVHHATVREPLLSPDSQDVMTRRASDQLGMAVEMQDDDHAQRTQKKREKNRIAQQRFRLRQKQLVSDLQSELENRRKEIDELKKQTSGLTDENKVLRDMLDQMGIDVEKLISKAHGEAQAGGDATTDNDNNDEGGFQPDDEKMAVDQKEEDPNCSS